MLKLFKKIEEITNNINLNNGGRNKTNFNFTQISLTSMWEKSFSNGSTIFVKNKNDDINKLKEATVIKTLSCFGEDIEVIELLIDNKKVSYSIKDNMEYFKLN